MCPIPFVLQCVHGWSNERSENRNRKNESEIFIRVEPAFPVICKRHDELEGSVNERDEAD